MKEYETAYATLDKIAAIKDREARKVALREALATNNPLAIVIQYTYHPDIIFNLPRGPIPPSIGKKSRHDEKNPFYFNIKKLKNFTLTHVEQKVLERNFLFMYENVAGDDADLLVGIKDKRLPWRELSGEFVFEALPELFPTGFLEYEEFVEEPTELPTIPDVAEGPAFTGEDAERFLDEIEKPVEQPVKRRGGRPKKVRT